MNADQRGFQSRQVFLRLLLLALFLTAAGARARAVEIYLYQRGYVEGGASPATRLTDAATTAFKKVRPDIEVRVIGVPWGKDGDLKLKSALLARRRIDCFRLAHDQLPAFIPKKGELLSPVDPYLTGADRADFGPAALAAVTHHGQAMAWPLWSTAIALVANKTVLARAKIALPAGRPWTWEEFTEVLRRVSHVTLDGHPVWGLNAAARPPLFEWAPLLMAHCGPLFEDQARTKPDGSLPLAPGLPEALRRVRALREAGLLAPGFGVDDDTAAQAGFLEGKTAFLLSSPGFIKVLVGKAYPFIILPPPTGAWGRPITTGALGCIAVVKSGDEKRTAAAHALARFLTSTEIASAVPGWYLAPPARASVHSFFAQPAYQPLAAILPTSQYLPTAISTGFMEGTFIPALQAAMLGLSEPAAAVQGIQEAASRVALR